MVARVCPRIEYSLNPRIEYSLNGSFVKAFLPEKERLF